MRTTTRLLGVTLTGVKLVERPLPATRSCQCTPDRGVSAEQCYNYVIGIEKDSKTRSKTEIRAADDPKQAFLADGSTSSRARSATGLRQSRLVLPVVTETSWQQS